VIRITEHNNFHVGKMVLHLCGLRPVRMTTRFSAEIPIGTPTIMAEDVGGGGGGFFLTTRDIPG
jgi:hypothetical protein